MDACYLDRVAAGYRGEVYGEAFYGAVSELLGDPDHARKFAVLKELEVAVRARLRPLMERLGGDTSRDGEWYERGLRDAPEYAGMPWDELMARFADELKLDIAEYEILEALAERGDEEALHFLVEHERVSLAFAERELAGRRDDSLDLVVALLDRLRDD